MTTSRVRTAINSPHTEPWLAPIGRLVVNFGALELHSYLWLALLSDENQSEETPIDWGLGQFFKQRVDRILLLLPQKLSDIQLVSDATDGWNEALSIAQFRNAVLHSPLVFAYSSPDENGCPDVIGLPDVRQLRKPSPIRPIAKLADINSAVSRIVSCATRLEQLRAHALSLTDPEVS